MADRPPYLTVVDVGSNQHGNDEEFLPLPYYSWDERPQSLPVGHDEAATAIYLSHGDIVGASRLLKVPIIRLNRLVRGSPRLQRILDEALGVALAAAASVPLRTLFDSGSDRRSLEWASTKVLQSRLGAGHPLSPAPSGISSSTLVSLTEAKTLTFRWRTDDDPAPGV